MIRFAVFSAANFFIALSSSSVLAQTISSVDYAWPEPPKVGDNALHVLTTNLLELKLINTKGPDPASVSQWDFVKNGQFNAPSAKWLSVTANGRNVSVSGIYFK